MQLYNTLTRSKEKFEPLEASKGVRMYVCGPTVYDRIHVGNARPFIVFDVLYRLLKHIYERAGVRVLYARNITDVEDKINARASERGISIRALTEETTRQFLADVAALGCLEPDFQPRATDHVADMIALIETLIAKGHAYEAQGHVLFHVPSMADYGQLSRRNREEMIAGARVEVAPYKRDPSDFVLWKPSSAELPGWDSPWGRGRPGWHVECSAMAKALLGERFDIHGGGIDLIFPHHENEIAQSVCAHDHGEFVQVWMHNGFLMTEGQKMAKSLGNFYTVEEILREFPGEAIRLLMLKTHYRQPLDFTKEGLREAKAQLDYFYRAHARAAGFGTSVQTDDSALAALYDDLNTPEAIGTLHELASGVLKDDAAAPVAASRMAGLASLLGLLQSEPDAWFHGARKDAEINEAEITELINARREARKARNFDEADRIRAVLLHQGVLLEDGPAGTTWRRMS
jgi:cysteinyl-tRNA synthetase